MKINIILFNNRQNKRKQMKLNAYEINDYLLIILLIPCIFAFAKYSLYFSTFCNK